MMRRGFLLVVILVLMEPSALALLGVSPGSHEVIFEPGLKQVFHFDFITDNPELRLEVVIEGDLSEYAELSSDILIGGGGVNVLLQLPNEIEIPGNHRLYVGVKPFVEEGGGLDIVANVRGVIKINVPYPGKYATLEFRSVDANAGDPIKFDLRVNSLGKEDITVDARIDIYDFNEQKIEALNLGRAVILSGATKDFSVKLDTTEYLAGDYRAVAVVDYADQTVQAEKIFRLGELFVSIYNYTEVFERDKINKFVIEAESFWNEPIENMYARVIIMNTSVDFLTPSVSISPWNKAKLEGFFDAKDVLEDEFVGIITLHYQGLTTEKMVDLRFRREVNYILYGTILGIVLLAVILLVIVIVLFVRRKSGRKSKKK